MVTKVLGEFLETGEKEEGMAFQAAQVTLDTKEIKGPQVVLETMDRKDLKVIRETQEYLVK